MEDDDCSTRHPLVPHVPFHIPPSPPCCLSCLLEAIAHESSITTRRQAALASLSPLPSHPDLLLSFSATVLTRIHSRLLALLLHSSSPPEDLVRDLVTFLSAFVHAADNLKSSSNSTSFIRLSISAACDAILRPPATRPSANYHPPLSFLANLLSLPTTSSHFDPHTVSRSNHLVTALLETPPPPSAWPQLTIVLPNLVSMAKPHIQPQPLLSLLHTALPPRRHSSADICYLAVIQALLSVSPTTSKLLFSATTFLQTLHNALLSNLSSLICSAAAVIHILAAQPQAASHLAASGTLDYLIEVLRRPQQTPCPSPFIRPLAHLIKSNPPVLHDKWHYIIPVLARFSVQVHPSDLSDFISLLAVAFARAPLSVLAEHMVDPIVAIAMRLCLPLNNSAEANTADHFVRAVDAVSVLLSRLRLEPDVLHNILMLCENIALPPAAIPPVLRLLLSCFTQFQRLASGRSTETSHNNAPPIGNETMIHKNGSLIILGRRLISLVFGTWKPIFEKLPERTRCETSTYTVDLCNLVKLVMDLFVASLDTVFCSIGAGLPNEQREMIVWCWSTLPLRFVFVCVSKTLDSSSMNDSIQAYVSALVFPQQSLTLVEIQRMPESEQAFINELSNNTDGFDKSPAFAILRKGIELKRLDCLCKPDLLLEALTKRLDTLLINTTPESVDHALEVVRAVSLICSLCRLRVPPNCLSMKVMEQLIERFDLTFSVKDFDILLDILPQTHLRDLHVRVWDIFVSNNIHCSSSFREQRASLWNALETDRVFAESVIHAILNSSNRDQLIEFLINLSEEQSNVEILSSLMERVGGVERLVIMLTDLPNINNTCGNSTENESYEEACQKISGLALILSCGKHPSNSDVSWSMTRTLCETIVREQVSVSMPSMRTKLLSVCFRYLVWTIQGSEDRRKIIHVGQCGVVVKVVRIIQVFCSEDDGVGLAMVESLVSSAVSLVVLLLNSKYNAKACVWGLLKEIHDDSTIWDSLLYFRSGGEWTEASYRIANCMCLLELFLIEDKLSKGRLTNNSLILICMGTGYIEPWVRNAAFSLLTSIGSVRTIRIEPTAGEYTRMMVDDVLVNKFCCDGKESLLPAEMRYLILALSRGVMDKFLGRIEEKGVSATSQTEGTVMDDFTASILSVVQGRLGLSKGTRRSPSSLTLCQVAGCILEYKLEFRKYFMVWVNTCNNTLQVHPLKPSA